MGSTKNKAIRNEHAKRYIEAVFEKRLLEEGFVCADDRKLCWCRVKNKEIINSICFFSPWHNLPLMLDIGYGIYPLFEPPAYTSDVHFLKRPCNPETFREQSIVEDREPSYIVYNEDIRVDAPRGEGRGLYTFDEIILPQMDCVNTIEECYEFHKQEYPQGCSNIQDEMYSCMSPTFIDEIIWFKDEELYLHCRERVNKLIEIAKFFCERSPSNAEYKRDLEHYEYQKAALFDGKREEFLQYLERRKANTIKVLARKYGIIV